MEIYDDRKPETISFKDLAAGECFLDRKNALYMKIFSDSRQVINFATGVVYSFDSNEQIILVTTEIRIK